MADVHEPEVVDSKGCGDCPSAQASSGVCGDAGKVETPEPAAEPEPVQETEKVDRVSVAPHRVSFREDTTKQENGKLFINDDLYP